MVEEFAAVECAVRRGFNEGVHVGIAHGEARVELVEALEVGLTDDAAAAELTHVGDAGVVAEAEKNLEA